MSLPKSASVYVGAESGWEREGHFIQIDETRGNQIFQASVRTITILYDVLTLYLKCIHN